MATITHISEGKCGNDSTCDSVATQLLRLSPVVVLGIAGRWYTAYMIALSR